MKLIIIALLILCVLFVIAFLRQEYLEKFALAVVLKCLASLCFVIIGIINSNGTSFVKLIITGLVFGFIADILLNLRHLFETQGRTIFLIGILIFLIGHILYLVAIIPLNNNILLCVAISVLITAILMKWIFTKITAEKAFKIFGIVYIGAIVLLNVVAISNMLAVPPHNSGFTKFFAAGAFLFLISDIVLILNTFGPESKFSLRATNIGMYYVGQILIAISLLFLK